MIVTKTISETRRIINEAKKKGKKIGLVPTMGALHDGHLSLVRQAKKDCDFVVVSIFVNPTQFGPDEDYKKYPRTLTDDKLLLGRGKVDLLFLPTAEEMYPQRFSTYVTEGNLSQFLCGKSRPGHFRGVCTVVTKLFNIITPGIAYFGQKDYQQVEIVKKMVKDLNFSLKIKTVPIAREENGLAMSSRNKYLNSSERKKALAISQSLSLAKQLIRKGERNCKIIKNKIKNHIRSKKSVKIDYVEVVDAKTLEPKTKLSDRFVIAIAVYLGKTRLIDNIILEA